jgi:hypothetical protein
VTAALPAGSLRILDLLTAAEAAERLRSPAGAGCSVKRVRRLAAEGVLVRVEVGSLVRFTPESVAAYRQLLTAGPEAAKTS